MNISKNKKTPLNKNRSTRELMISNSKMSSWEYSYLKNIQIATIWKENSTNKQEKDLKNKSARSLKTAKT